MAGMAVAGIALFVVGMVAGAAFDSNHAPIAAQQKQISTRRRQVRMIEQNLVTA